MLQKENNFYKGEEDLIDTQNLIGVVSGNEYTISQLNDLSYKGDQQEGMPIIYFSSKEELKEACKTCGIDIWEHPLCAYCGKVIRGSSTWASKGTQCWDCSNLENLEASPLS